MPVQEPNLRSDGLQINDHPGFQRVFWRVERVAWIGFVFLILLAVLGLTGAGGLFADRTLQVGGAEITQTQFARWQTTHRLLIRMPATAAVDPVISISDDYAEDFTAEAVMPQPARVDIEGGMHHYHFSSHSGPRIIVFDLTPRQPGIYRHDLAIDGRSVSLTTYVLP